MRIFIFVSLLFSAQLIYSQNIAPVFGRQNYISGYHNSIKGEVLSYTSIYPKYANKSLLTRCTDGKKDIEWQTDPIPKNETAPFIYFSWIAAHSTGTSSGTRYFDMYLDDKYVLTFTTHEKNYPPFWSFESKDTLTKLVFELQKRDANNDAHGMCYLRIPTNQYQKGKPLSIKIVGKNQNSNDWYMTFTYSFKEKIEVSSMPFIYKSDSTFQPININVLHFGAPTSIELMIDGQPVIREINYGFNTLEEKVKRVSNRKTVIIIANIPNYINERLSLEIKPIHFSEINLVHHSHTDIGYSDYQEKVIQIHNDNIYKALSLIKKTKNYPKNSQFVWNIESSWAVENFMNIASEDSKNEFLDAVRNGKIVISATYANILTGLSTPEEMNWICDYSSKLREKYHIPIQTAMMSDVPGMSWSMIPAFAKHNIRYFSNGPNYIENMQGHGDRIGTTLEQQGNKAFWWLSSSGKDSILFWTCGKGYSSWHGVGQGHIRTEGPEKIANYLFELDSLQYPYDMVHWRYNIVSDNAPTDSTISDFVAEWNEKYISPKLILANATDMFLRFEEKYGKQIPSIKGDFTPYWEDGAYSTAYEETLTREKSEKLLQLENIAIQNHIKINDNDLNRAKRAIVMFHEHTWGAFNSISEPDNPMVVKQWLYKKNFLDSALIYIDKIDNQIEELLHKENQITVYNTLNWNRTDIVHFESSKNLANYSLKDQDGNSIELFNNNNGSYSFIAQNIPMNGKKTYHFIPKIVYKENKPNKINFEIDSIYGGIKSLIINGLQWVEPTKYNNLNQPLYIAGLDPNQFSLPNAPIIEPPFSNNLIYSQKVKSELIGTNGVVCTITQYNNLDYLKISTTIDKKTNREKESAHIAFPFSIPNAKVKIGVDNTYITPEEGQIAGANKDFFNVQRWIEIGNEQNGVVMCSPHASLFEIGEMVNEIKNNRGFKEWKKTANSSSTIFIYAMNNYWHTNFKADQEGKVTFDIYLKFYKKGENIDANKFGYEITQPLIAY